MRAIDRQRAKEMLAAHDLTRKDRDWRADELVCVSVSDLDEQAAWLEVSSAVRDEVMSSVEHEIADPEHPRFDPVFLLSIQGDFAGATNSYLENRLRHIGHDDVVVTGDVEPLQSCPCCGRRTLSSRDEYEICRVCWWEDDGQDNADASEVFGGPNGNVSLTLGRVNFLRHGLSDPQRLDLVPLAEAPEKYEIGRTFQIDEGRSPIVELGGNWEALAPR